MITLVHIILLCLTIEVESQFAAWNRNYNLGYSNWDGFWRHEPSDPLHYKRKKREKECKVCSENRFCKNVVVGGRLDKCSRLYKAQGTIEIFNGVTKTQPAGSITINSIYATVFDENSKCTKLYIDVTDLSYFDPEICNKLKNLEILQIARSKLKEMPDLSKCTKLKELDLYENEIQIYRHNSSKLPSSLEKIILIKNKIDKVPDEYFNLPNLKWLALGDNQMRYFPGNAFGSLNKNLAYLGADGNQITSLSLADLETLGKEASSFKHLNVSNNQISYIAPNAISTLQELVVLEIQGNKIPSDTKESFWNIPKVKHISLYRNKLDILPSQFIQNCSELIKIFFQDQQMEAVYFDSMADVPKLQEISFGNNKLDHIPHALFFETDNWNNLATLHFDNNVINSLTEFSIKDFPANSYVHYLNQKRDFEPFKYLRILRNLYLRSNQLSELGEDDLKHLTKLKVLFLDDNQLRESKIHEKAFDNNPLLESLRLSANAIQYVPKALRTTKLTNLLRISLDNNQVTYVLSGTFTNLKRLQTIDLSSNKILTIEENSFPTSATELIFDDNQIKFKSGNIFKGLVQIARLSFIDNQIDVLPDELFKGLINLWKIEFRSNLIGRLNKALFEGVNKLREIYFNKNKITYIEDGTFAGLCRNTGQKMILHLQGNQLTQIPLTDFWGMDLNQLKLSENYLTKIRTNSFVNITECGTLDILQNRLERIEEYAFNTVECDNINIGGDSDFKNPVREVESFAFKNVKSLRKIDLSFFPAKIMRTNAFQIKARGALPLNLWISSGSWEIIESNAIDVGSSERSTLNLQSNLIRRIERKIFADGVRLKKLDLSKNKISTVSDEAFKGSRVLESIRLEQNELKNFPVQALSVWVDLIEIALNANNLETLPSNSFDSFPKLERIEMFDNKISILRSNLFYNNPKLKKINMQKNELTFIEDDVFTFKDDINQLEYFYVSSDRAAILDHIPKFKSKMNKLKELTFRNVRTVAADAFGKLNRGVLTKIILDTIVLECDCQLYKTLKPFVNKIQGRYLCSDRRAEIKRIEVTKKFFICNPSNLVMTAPEDFMLRISYTAAPSVSALGEGFGGVDPEYHAECKLREEEEDAAKIFTGSSKLTYIDIRDKDLLPGRFYWCYLYMTHKTVQSPKTKKIFGSTKPRKENPTQCIKKDAYECQINSTVLTDCDVEASNAMGGSCDKDGSTCKICYRSCVKCTVTVLAIEEFKVTFYDFKAADSSIGQLVYSPDPAQPKYMNSPYGSWLDSNEKEDLANYFRPTDSRNIEIKNKQLVLAYEGEKDPANDQNIFRYFNSEYWQINQEGFGTEGQRNLKTKESINVGFTSVLRTGFKFTGTEHFQFGGGESMWVYINKVLIVHVITNVDEDEDDKVECKTFQLKNTTLEGGIVTPSVGTVDTKTKTCVGLIELPDEAVNISLKAGVIYHLDIFHVEKFAYDSNFFFYASGVNFVNASEPIIDYVAMPMEDANVNAIISEINLWKLYGLQSTPFSFTVTLLSGNAEDRFTIKDDTPATRKLAEKEEVDRVYNNITLNSNNYNELIVLCDAKDDETIIKETVTTSQDFTINTNTGLLVLKNNLDYETTQEYLLKMTVKDATDDIGNIYVQIFVGDQSDNCPIFVSKNFSLQHPIPPLQSLFQVSATDKDSGENGRILYVLSHPIKMIPKIESKLIEGTNFTSNKTLYWTVTHNVFAIDNGNPKHGDYFPIEVRFDESCREKGHVIVDPDTGVISFNAPGMTIFDKKVFRHYEEQCYRCAAGKFCPGNSSEFNCTQQAGDSQYTYSFGMASNCSSCPEGWLCHDGVLVKCEDNTYVKCNSTWCPKQCLPCPPGFHCTQGVRNRCRVGQFSNGKEPCRLCLPGYYSNTTESSTCQCCPEGYESTYMKDTCVKCRHHEFSKGCSMCKSCFGNCACDTTRCSDGRKCHNIGPTGNAFICGECPNGFETDGPTNCKKINECKLNNPCINEDSCVQLNIGFKCKSCKFGYVGNAPYGVGVNDTYNNTQICKDFDECSLPEYNICDPNSECINLPGNYSCGKCNVGYVGNGYVGCRPGDLCKADKDNCHENATCITLGSERYKCECKDGYAGDGVVCSIDSDYDGITDNNTACLIPACEKDNCIGIPNGGQEDNDGDQRGDVCDDDDDDDYRLDVEDNCQFFADNTGLKEQSDIDNDGVGDICDNCKNVKNPDQEDTNADKVGDVCDTSGDIDGDSILNDDDNCKFIANKNQVDSDNDGIGDACDNCAKHNDASQVDLNENGFGDICDTTDKDGDGIIDTYDNCVDLPNGEQTDTDGDNIGDACDTNKDGDAFEDGEDNCMYVKNDDQLHQDDFDIDARPVGVACVNDFDNDGVSDGEDTCPYTSNIKATSFQDHFVVALGLNSTTQPKAKWRIRNKGRDIEQLQRTMQPSMLIGAQSYGGVNYSGVLFVNTKDGIDYMGVVFGYQSNRKFYLALWRHENINLNNTYKAAIKGVQIKLIDSENAFTKVFSDALWYSQDTAGEVSLLWQDSKMTGWQHETPYIFNIEFRPSLGRIRLLIKQGESILTDSGYIYNTAITGGKLGVYTYGQHDVIWSRLKAKCLERLNRAIYFGAPTSCVITPTLKHLNIIDSFTFTLWVKLPEVTLWNENEFAPILCDSGKAICLFMKKGSLTATVGDFEAISTYNFNANEWYHLALRYDGQGTYTAKTVETKPGSVKIYVNGVENKSTKSEFVVHDFFNKLYIGCHGSNNAFLNITVDEVALFNRYLREDEIITYMKTAGLLWEKHLRILSAHYTADQHQSAVLYDESEYENNANVTSITWVEGTLDKKRFQLTHTNNIARRSVHTEL